RVEQEKGVDPAQSVPPTKKKTLDAANIDSFLGISSDFKTCAISDGGGVKIMDLQTGQKLASPTWDPDWGTPRSVAFGKNAIAVVTDVSVRVFSRKNGELEQNIRSHVGAAAFTADGRFLAIISTYYDEVRRGKGGYLVLRDMQEKKPIAEVPLGFGFCFLSVSGNRLAAWASWSEEITVVETEGGHAVKKLKSGCRRREGFGAGLELEPVAI